MTAGASGACAQEEVVPPPTSPVLLPALPSLLLLRLLQASAAL
jgi:hypothetical protein